VCRNKAIAILLVATLLLPAKSAAAQAFVYFDQDQAWFLTWTPTTQNNWPEMGHYYDWGERANWDPPQIGPLKWRITSASPQVNNWTREAIQEWDALLPSWIAWQEVQPGQAVNLTISEAEGACFYVAVGCFWITGWAWEGTKRNNSWVWAAVRIDFGANRPKC
jgi:hypothetical protein